MIYLTYLPQTYATHNKLQEKVLELMKNNARRMIYVEELDDFKSNLLAGIESLNTAFPRCNPVKITFYITVDRVATEAVDYFVSWKGHQFCDFKILSSR